MTAASGTAPQSAGTAHSAATASSVARPERAAPVVFPGFDGLRAIAALLVLLVHVAFHSGLTTGNRIGVYTARGEIGVAVFFVISGFLLYRPFAVAHLAGRSAPDAAGFYIRRLLRIIPLYWLALAVALNVVANSRLGVHGFTGLLQTAFFLQGYRQEWAIQGLTQAWTLNVEFAFYLSVPLYAWLLVRRARPPRAQLRVELVALATIFVISRVLHYLLIGSDIWWADGWTVWLPVWWDLFSMGMLLAVLSAWYTQQGRTPRWARSRWSGGVCWLIAAFFYWVASTRIDLPLQPLFEPDRSQDMGRHLFYGLFGFFLVLPAVFGRHDQGLVRRFLAWRPMAYLGLISYGIYLWHTTVIDLVLEHTGSAAGELAFVPFFALVFVLTCAVSTITYFLVERPCMALGRDWARRVRKRAAPAGEPRQRLPATAGPGESDHRAADGAGPEGPAERYRAEEFWATERAVDERWREELAPGGHRAGGAGPEPDEAGRTMPLRTGRPLARRGTPAPRRPDGGPAGSAPPGTSPGTPPGPSTDPAPGGAPDGGWRPARGRDGDRGW